MYRRGAEATIELGVSSPAVDSFPVDVMFGQVAELQEMREERCARIVSDALPSRVVNLSGLPGLRLACRREPKSDEIVPRTGDESRSTRIQVCASRLR